MAHLQVNNLLVYEQIGSRGTKDQLVCKDSKKITDLTMAWIDYQKAYDSVPHTWILETPRLYTIDPRISELMEESMKKWCTTLRRNGEALAEIKIKCGIFQGMPISTTVPNSTESTEQHNRTNWSWLHTEIRTNSPPVLYMDDLKLYARK